MRGGILAVLLVELVASLPARAQVSHQVSLSGYVLPAFQVQAGQPHTATAAAEAWVWQVGPNEVAVEVIHRRPGEAATVTLPLALRTNADRFALRASCQGPGGEGSLTLSAPHGSGNGLLVAPEAVAAFDPQPIRCGPAELLATGSRISLRGSFRSPDNALLTTATISLPPSTRNDERVYRFRLVMDKP